MATNDPDEGRPDDGNPFKGTPFEQFFGSMNAVPRCADAVATTTAASPIASVPTLSLIHI